VLAGVAVLPSAPVLVPGVSPAPPPQVRAVADEVDACVEGLADYDRVVLLAAGEALAVHACGRIDLAGLGRGDIRAERPVAARTVEALAERLGCAAEVPDRLPLAHAVLGLLLGAAEPVAAVSVPAEAEPAALQHSGIAVVRAVADAADEGRALLVVAGDLSAGIGPRAPWPDLDGAAELDAQIVDLVDQGRLERLAGLGDEAARVHATGWPALVAAQGALGEARLGLARRSYAAPAGVGYLVAHGA